jgi:hypothetical protein
MLRVLDHQFSTAHFLNDGTKVAECMKEDFIIPEKVRQGSVKRKSIQKKSGFKTMFDLISVVYKEDSDNV